MTIYDRMKTLSFETSRNTQGQSTGEFCLLKQIDLKSKIRHLFHI